MADQTEGRAVREAFDGPEISYDTFIQHHTSQARFEDSSASTMGEARQERGEFLEDTGLNGKAVSAMRAGLKLKDEAKQRAWLRSMEALLPIVKDHIIGNTTEDWVESADKDEIEEDSRDFHEEAAGLDDDNTVAAFPG
ncbi:MAG: hypothetical protein RI571_06490 [Roseovarius sp.]|nr:hypothetical protein [Roseovarius sp.]